jgi:hypothetical protein
VVPAVLLFLAPTTFLGTLPLGPLPAFAFLSLAFLAFAAFALVGLGTGGGADKAGQACGKQGQAAAGDGHDG